MNDHSFDVGIDENGDEYYIPKPRWGMISHDQRLLEHELSLINDVVDRFALAMKAKMHKKAEEGFRGWNDPNHAPQFRAMLEEHITKDRETAKQMVDVGNLAMMVWLADIMKAEAEAEKPDAEKPDMACPHCCKDIADRLFENVERDEWGIVANAKFKLLDTINYCPYCSRGYRLECMYDEDAEAIYGVVISKEPSE